MRTLSLISIVAVASLTSSYACKHTEDAGTAPVGTDSASSPLLRRATSCEDLTLAIQADTRARVAQMVEEQSYYDDGSGFPVPDAGAPSGWGAAGGMSNTGGAMSSMGGGAVVGTGSTTGGVVPGVPGNGEGDPTGETPPGYTKTNTQVAGVDEADIVKTDGQNIYVLRTPLPDATGMLGSPEVVVAHAWPAEEAAVSARTSIEGSPVEMFVIGEPGDAERKVVVYSTLDGSALYQEAGLPVPENKGYVADCWDWTCSYNAAPLTKITLLTLQGGALSVERELYYEGSYLSARRAGNIVRTSLQLASRAPAVRTFATAADHQRAEMLVLEELLKAGRSVAEVSSEELSQLIAAKVGDVLVLENEAAIAEMTADAWLPRVFSRSAGSLEVETLGCTEFYLPHAGTGLGGVTSLALLDLDAPSGEARGAAMVGVADTMYQNASAIVMAAREWSFVPEPDGAQEQTVLHAFDVSDPTAIRYQASGQVPGAVYGQFAIDERDGVLRVATTETTLEGTSNRVSLLEPNGEALTTRGTIAGLAPGETVSAVRWVGDTGYVVTRVQARDPLFVVDVADPTAPKLLGELAITGFSEYLHPLDDNHLLAIGRDGEAGGEIVGNVALRIYDVTDRAAPREEHVLPFQESGDSLAEANHKAFSYYAEQNLLAVPFVTYAADVNGYWRPRNTIELFHVSVEDGLRKLGSLDADVLLTSAERMENGYYCDYYGDPVVERGLFIGDTLYATGERGIIAADVENPSVPLAVVPFQEEGVPYNCWSGYGGVAGGTGGFAGATGGAAFNTGGTMPEETGGVGTGGFGTGGTAAVPSEAGAPAL